MLRCVFDYYSLSNTESSPSPGSTTVHSQIESHPEETKAPLLPTEVCSLVVLH